jgi:8-oxo-dGTP pyrophosphatase MutT (NUDIX family)
MRTAILTWCFALVVVRSRGRFLLVQERKHGQLWYLPAGGVEPGESFLDAARRETLEEAGIRVRLQGILRLQYTPVRGGQARLRAIFIAEPEDDSPPKSVADEESLQGAWVTVDDLEHLPLRGEEVRRILKAVDAGAPLYPLSLLGNEDQGLDSEW